MVIIDLITYAAAKKYTDKAIAGAGPIRGEDGLTPFIGDNGNWWIGETDTGVSATQKNVEVDGTLNIDIDNNRLFVVKDGQEKDYVFGDRTQGIDIERINDLFQEKG